MELKKECIQVMRTKSRATAQVTFDSDFNVPDVKADIGRVIQNKGNVTVDEVRLTEGHAYLTGNLQVDLLYVGEGEGNVYSLEAKLPFEETLNLEGIVSGDKMCLQWETEDISVHIIHSRKMNIKAIVSFMASVDQEYRMNLPVNVEEEGISVKKKHVRVMTLQVHKKDTLRIKEEIVLASNKPNVAELLWYTQEVRGLDMRPEENAIRAKGELFVFVLYAGDEEGSPLQWSEYALPFNSRVECSGSAENLIPNIQFSVINRNLEVKPDSDGEQRVLTAEMVLELNMDLYREQEADLIQDVYSPSKECIPVGKKEYMDSLLIRNFSRCRVSDRVPVKETQGKILQICHSDGKVKIEKTKVTEQGIQADGIISLKVLYIVGNDEIPFYSMEVMLPFTHVVEARGITQNSVYYLQAGLEQLSTTMIDSNEIEIKAAIGLNALVSLRQEELIIDHIEEHPLDKKLLRSLPGITVYMVKPGDTLWDIAKHCYTTIEDIRQVNNLADEDIRPGQPLLVVKKV